MLPNTSSDLNARFDSTELTSDDGGIASQLFNREEVLRLAESNLDFFAALVLPDTCELAFPAMHTIIWNMLHEAIDKPVGFDRLAIGIPRGFVKTTLMKLAITRAILHSDRQFILIIGNTATRAEDILSDISDMLDDSNVVATYGNWRDNIEKDTAAVKKFNFRGRNIVIAALGVGGSVRGLNIKNRRPDLIVMDDMQSWAEAESKKVADDMLTWMTGTLMKAASKRRCVYAFVGNLYPFEGSILRRLRDNPLWTSIIVGALLSDGQSIWPELQSTEQLIAEFEHDIAMGKPEIFLAEVLNDTDAISRSGIDVGKIPLCEEGIFQEAHQGAFIIIDPAGHKKNSDLTEIGVCYLYDGVPYVLHVSSGIMNPMQTITEALRLAVLHKASVIAAESVAYQASLLFWFEQVARQFGIAGIEFVPVFPRGFSKNARIKTMLTDLVTGRIFVSKHIRSRVIHQIVNWNPIKIDNVDDLLDILAYLYQVIELYGHFLAVSDIVEGADFLDAQVMALDDNSLF